MRKTIISWLVNASVAAFAVGALQIPFGDGKASSAPALIFSAISLAVAIYLSKGDK